MLALSLGYRLSAIGYRLLAIGYSRSDRLLAIREAPCA